MNKTIKLESGEPIIAMTESDFKKILSEASAQSNESGLDSCYIRDIGRAVNKLLAENSNDYQLQPHLVDLRIIMRKYGK